MADPLQRSTDTSPLFGTSHAAGQKAALRAGSWRARIIDYLSREPACLFEIAAAFNVPDHCISGRFTELKEDGYIEPTGGVRRKPQTDCDCEIYRLRRDRGADAPSLVSDYPLSVRIDQDIFDRQELLPRESYPGIPYARRADSGGLRQAVRIEIIECPGCGSPLRLQPDEPGRPRPEKPQFTCGNPNCLRSWRVRTLNESGKAPLLALVMETIR